MLKRYKNKKIPIGKKRKMKKNAVGKNRKREKPINRKKINGQERDKNAEKFSMGKEKNKKKNEKFDEEPLRL